MAAWFCRKERTGRHGGIRGVKMLKYARFSFRFSARLTAAHVRSPPRMTSISIKSCLSPVPMCACHITRTLACHSSAEVDRLEPVPCPCLVCPVNPSVNLSWPAENPGGGGFPEAAEGLCGGRCLLRMPQSITVLCLWCRVWMDGVGLPLEPRVILSLYKQKVEGLCFSSAAGHITAGRSAAQTC